MPQIKRAPKRLVDLDDVSGLLTALADGYVLTYDHDTGEFVLLPGGTMSASDILTAVKTVDGTGSGLDADYLDGNNADAFATSGHTHEVDQRADVFSDAEGDPAVIGTAADGVSTYAARRDHVHDVNATTIRGKGFFDTSNDGTGSGLDADLLDGSHASAFAASGHAHSGTYQPLDADLTAIANNTVTEEATPASGDFALGWTAEGTLRKYDVGNLPASGGTDDQTAAEVPFTPAGNIEATDVQAAIQELDGEKAASSHTHAVGDVTTLYSDEEGDPAAIGTAADGTSTYGARRDHVHNFASQAEATVLGRAADAGVGVPAALTAGNLIDILETADGTGSGLDADTVDGSHASAFAAASHAHAAGDVTSGTLAHERGGLEADVSAYSGLVKISGGATSQATAGTDYAAASHTQTASTITDFAAATAATAAVTANTAKVTNATHTGDVTGSGALTIAANAVTNAKAADMVTATIKGRVTAGTGDPEDLTAAQVRTLINVEDGAAADQSASEILTAIKTVDGAGSGLDADYFDGMESSLFATKAGAEELTNKTLTSPLLTAPVLTLLGLTSGTTVNWNMSAGTSAFLQLSHNATLAAPTNIPANGIGWLQVDHNNSYTIAFNSAYKNRYGGTLDIIPVMNAVSTFLVIIQSSVVYLLNLVEEDIWQIPLSGNGVELAAATNIAGIWYAPYSGYYTRPPFLTVGGAPTGSGLTLDMNISGGASILSTKITIDVNETKSTDAATQPVWATANVVFAKGQGYTFDLDAVGSTYGGDSLTLNLPMRRIM